MHSPPLLPIGSPRHQGSNGSIAAQLVSSLVVLILASAGCSKPSIDHISRGGSASTGVVGTEAGQRRLDSPALDSVEVQSPFQLGESGDWPQLFGCYGNSSSLETQLSWDWDQEGPPFLWRLPVGLGYSSPVIAGEQLILQHRVDDEEHIDALDAETSQRLWRCSRPTAYHCDYPYSHGPYATPTIGPDSIYAVTAEGELLAIARETGELLWSRQLLTEFDAPKGAFGFGNSPRLCGDLLILNVGGRPQAGIVALDAVTGETRWTATDHNRSHTTAVPAMQHGHQRLYVLTEEALVSLELATGKVLWEIPFGVRDTPERVNAVTPVVVGNRVIMCSGPGPGMVILDINPDGSYNEVSRQRRVLDPQYTNLLPLGNSLYGVTSRASAVVRCADLDTGEQLWEYVSDLCRANSLFVDGHIIFLGEHGHLALLRPSRSGPDVAWISEQPLIQGPCYSAPALSRGRLYLRNERELVCLDLRGARISTRRKDSVVVAP